MISFFYLAIQTRLWLCPRHIIVCTRVEFSLNMITLKRIVTK